MEIVHVYQKKRREFGRQCNFSDRHARLIVDINPDESLRDDYIVQNPVNMSVQNTFEFSEHEVNTERKEYSSQGINHTEGGWPKDVDPNEAEQTIRFRKKVEKDEHFIASVIALGETALDVVKQNNSVDIYQDYYPTVSEMAAIEAPSARMLNVFRDPNAIKRSVTALSWFPDQGRKIAAAYSVLEFQKTLPGTSMESYIWDLEHPNTPELALTPSSQLLSLEYNPKDVHIILGGQYNGQIGVWDTRRGSRPIEVSPIERSHRDPVHSVKFLSSKTGTECFSTSTDGQVLWWDIRKLSEPTDQLLLDTGRGQWGGVVVEYESTMPTKFMVGSEQGAVVLGNRKAKTPAERIAGTYEGHHGPVYTVERNPFSTKFFLTVGDWTSRIWSEDIRESSVLTSRYHPCYLTCGTWSRTRPGVAFTCRADGVLDVWDYLFKTNDAVLTVKVSDFPLRSVRAEESGKHLACGDHNGNITLLELNSALAVMQQNEKANMSALLDREASREKVLVSRMRELALKERAKSAKKPQADGGAEGGAEGGAAEDEEEDPIAVAEEIYWETINGTAGKSKKKKAVEGEEGAAPAEGAEGAAEPAPEN